MSKRVAMVINVKSEYRVEYLKLHENADPAVMQAIREAHHKDYTIFILGELLVCTFTYTGNDLNKDRATLRAKPELQEWMHKTASMQEQFEIAQDGSWWSIMDEVLYSA